MKKSEIWISFFSLLVACLCVCSWFVSLLVCFIYKSFTCCSVFFFSYCFSFLLQKIGLVCNTLDLGCGCWHLFSDALYAIIMCVNLYMRVNVAQMRIIFLLRIYIFIFFFFSVINQSRKPINKRNHQPK